MVPHAIIIALRKQRQEDQELKVILELAPARATQDCFRGKKLDRNLYVDLDRRLI